MVGKGVVNSGAMATMTCNEFRKYISAYVDHEISVERAMQLEEHVQACSACSRLLQAEQWVAESVRQFYPRVACPPALEERIRNAVVDRGALTRSLRLLPAAAGLAVILLLVWALARTPAPDRSLPPRVALAAQLYKELLKDQLPLSVRSHDVAVLDQWLAEHLGFYPRGTLRSPDGLLAEGAGVVHAHGEMLGAVAYQSPRGAALLLIGVAERGPGGGTTVAAKETAFRTFIQGRRKFVAWKHGKLSYVLVSEGEQDGARACSSCHTGVTSDRLADFPGVTGQL